MSVDRKKDKFPDHLLNESIEERYKYFDDYIVEHPFLEDAVNDTVSKILKLKSQEIIVVCGPSGVGKQELFKMVKEKVSKFAETKPKKQGCIPVVSFEADAPDFRSFEFPMLWKKLLEELREPLIDKKITYVDEVVINDAGERVIMSRAKKGELKDILIKTLKYRETYGLLIDEAQHLLRHVSGKKVNWAIDVMKSFANKSPTPVVLVGTYALTDFLDDLEVSYTDQLIRRAKVVEFKRYRNDVEADVRKFADSVYRLLRNMPFKNPPVALVKQEIPYFYKYSCGCIGLLKTWLEGAYELALNEGMDTLTKEHLEETRFSGRQCENILMGIIEGENKLKKIRSEGKLEEMLGLGNKNKRVKVDENINEPKKAKPSNTRPFACNPKRNVVG